jgi:hypothetical protein
MADWSPFQRVERVYAKPYQPGQDMQEILVSAEDRQAGSPKAGDYIARDVQKLDRRWLISAASFAANWTPASEADFKVNPAGEAAPVNPTQ